MSINIGPPSVEELRPRITVIGVGGAGGNAIANMIEGDIEGVDFIVANTDAQALNTSVAEHRIQLGPDITQGLGAGSRPEVGRAAAEETVEEVERALEGVNMVFIAAGMGGGTGTGAAPVIAQTARSKGILTVGVVTKPFLFEGTRRMRAAEAGIEELQKNVDTLIVIPNQNLFLVAKAETTFKEAFQLADEVLQQGVRSITDLMVMPGLINLDFADVRSVMNEMGKAMMGTGEGEGENRALEAAERAIANPLLDGVSMQGAKGVIISIIGGEDMKLLEVDEAANHIRELVDPEANIIWGSAFNPDLEGRIRVSVVATGIEQGGEGASPLPNRQTGLSNNARGPKKPVLPPPTQEELDEDVAASPRPQGSEFAQPARFEDEDEGDAAGGTVFSAVENQPTAEPASADVRVPEPFEPTGFGDDEEEEDEGLVDPADDSDFGADDDDGYASLTGTRISRDDLVEGDEGEDEADDDGEDPWAEIGEGSGDDDGGGDNAADRAGAGDALELTNEAEGEPEEPVGEPQDELLLDASRLAAADDDIQPAGSRRRRMFGGGAQSADEPQQAAPAGQPPAQQAAPPRTEQPRTAPAAAADGSTLFERMANLSRSKAGADETEEEEEDEDGGASLRIPRFLGRQNNQ